MLKRIDALGAAKQFRTCPPVEIWSDPVHRGNIETHLRICPYCSGKTKNELTTWNQLLKSFRKNSSPEDPLRITPPKPFEIRPIVKPTGIWSEGFFYVPPIVLIVDYLPDMCDAVLAAQIYHDLRLAGPGDIILPPDSSSLGDPFVETWNMYLLEKENLGPVIDTCESKVAQAVLDVGKRRMAPPAWVPTFFPLTEKDPRKFFREIEKEVGRFFSIPSPGMDLETKNVDANRVFPGGVELRGKLQHLFPGLHWPFFPETAEEIFATARFPDSWYEKAASDRDEKRVWANLVVIRNNRVEKMEPIRGEIQIRESLSDKQTIFGRFTDMPKRTGPSRLFVLLCKDDGSCVSPETVRWDPDNHRFFIRFPEKNMEDAELKMALIYEESL